jgi:hypothetical protein
LCCWKQGHVVPCCAKRNLCSRAVSEKNRMARESIPKSWQGNLSRMNGFTRTWVVTELFWWWWQWYKY